VQRTARKFGKVEIRGALSAARIHQLAGVGERSASVDAKKAGELDFFARAFVSVCPPSSTPSSNFYSHRNGAFQITFLAPPSELNL
jgi:hypothetical protein